VIAAYQACGFVGRAVTSALAQTLPPVEVIVCDDGSTDDIEGALEPYLDRIVFLRLEHRGEAAAKNAGIRAASGDFVSILDADNAYEPERNEALAELAIARPDLDVLTTDCYLEVDGRVIKRGAENWPFQATDQRRGLLRRSFIFPDSAIRRTRLLEVGGYHDMPRTVDWDLMLRLVFSGSRAGLVDRPLVRYGLREDSESHADAVLQKRAEVNTLEKAARTLDLTEDEREVLARSLEKRRRDARLEEVRAAVRERAPEARRKALGIATARGYGLPTRVKTVISAAAPGAARRRLLAREQRQWFAAGTVIPRQRVR
jgi:glycosyltransferase involved in cell wall biosynthesis